jgi:dCMP deaminase
MADTLDALKMSGVDPSLYVVKTRDGKQRKILILFKISIGYAVALRGDASHAVLANGEDHGTALNNAVKVIEGWFPDFKDAKVELYQDPRPSWDHYFMDIAKQVAKRGTCPRKAVGAIIVMERRILTTGYNGAIPGLPHCIEVGCDLIPLADGSVNCHRIVHAEMNALLQAAHYGVSVAGGDLYVNTYPCWGCFKAVATAKIRRIFYADAYRNDPRVVDAAQQAEITINQVSTE